jgi:hypothetical protein
VNSAACVFSVPSRRDGEQRNQHLGDAVAEAASDIRDAEEDH